MGKNQDYKNRALASLEGKWMNGIIATVIMLLLSGGVGTIFDFTLFNGSGSIWELILLPLTWGYAVYFLNMVRNEDISYVRLFDGFKSFLRIFLALFLVAICSFIGFLLLIIPGFIVALMFAMTSYILKDNEEIGVIDAMKQSKAMMDGHKMELFWLSLSFIGWAILSILSFGFGFLFLLPYMYAAYAHFYEDLKAEQAI